MKTVSILIKHSYSPNKDFQTLYKDLISRYQNQNQNLDTAVTMTDKHD